jgi:hypothetical protein
MKKSKLKALIAQKEQSIKSLYKDIQTLIEKPDSMDADMVKARFNMKRDKERLMFFGTRSIPEKPKSSASILVDPSLCPKCNPKHIVGSIVLRSENKMCAGCQSTGYFYKQEIKTESLADQLNQQMEIMKHNEQLKQVPMAPDPAQKLEISSRVRQCIILDEDKLAQTKWHNHPNHKMQGFKTYIDNNPTAEMGKLTIDILNEKMPPDPRAKRLNEMIKEMRREGSIIPRVDDKIIQKPSEP